MQEASIRSRTSTIDIYIKLAQYPILSDRIRERMREEIFRRGIVDEETFEQEVERLAVASQKREGVHDPYRLEPATVWQERKARIRAFHTDFYFGYNLPTQLFEQIIREVLSQQPESTGRPELLFNPEVAPWSLLFKQGEVYESMPPEEREKVGHHLEEIKVVLIKGMISDQLPYIGVAKKVFSVADLRAIYERRIGEGKIGGKAAGMLLAWKILERCKSPTHPAIKQQVTVPDSYFLATDMIYEFHRLNNLEEFMNQKYRPVEEMRSEYPRIVDAHLGGQFPPSVVKELRKILREWAERPIIVRSSSLLEDNFGHAFAGKYQSHFCPNQGSEEENLEALLDAIRHVYASTLNPDALLYRKRHNLIDYDERMAILLQPVRGQRFDHYYFPAVAGVGFSRNPFRWNPKIQREEGFLRLVWGMGTRAVDRVSDDYPRLVALSHATLRPETTARAVRQYSQHYLDVIDLEENAVSTLPVKEVLDLDYPYLRYLFSVDEGDYVRDILSVGSVESTKSLVLTFDPLLKDRNFVNLMRTALNELEEAYGTPVDVEFTVEIIPDYPQPEYRLNLLQCRPLSERESGEAVSVPADLPEKDVLFSSSGLIPDGQVEGVRYIIFVDPITYRKIHNQTTRLELGRAIGRLNKILEEEPFILIGPGRWGSANIELGVRVTYADIFNTEALIEMAVAGEDGVPELSYGTHFFQDLVEGGIYSLPLHLEHPDSIFRWEYFHEAPNKLAELSPPDAGLSPYLKVIDLAQLDPDRRLTIVMDGSQDQAVGYLQEGHWPKASTEGSLSIF